MVTGEVVQIEREGSAMPAYFARPENANETTPTVAMAMHLWGVDREQRATADRFATEGFAAIVPDLYARFGAPNGDEVDDYSVMVPFAQRLEFATVDPDIRAAAAWIRTQFPKTKSAIVGFCMGGTMALRRTYGYTDIFSAAAVWYGALGDTDPNAVDIPIVASYGAQDHGIPVESVQRFAGQLRVPHDFKVYEEAGHAFFDNQRAAYRKEAAEDSWRRSIAFLREHTALKKG